MKNHPPTKYHLQKCAYDPRDIVVNPAQTVKLPSVSTTTATVMAASRLPPSVDLRPLMPPVLTQGDLGACASNAGSNALRFLLNKERQIVFQPSRLYLYYNTRVNVEHGSPMIDSGVTIRDLCKAIQQYHACSETIWPYDISRFTIAPPLEAYKNAELHHHVQYRSVPQNLTALKSVLAGGYPILFGVVVYDSFESDYSMETGTVRLLSHTDKILGGHALLMCGYCDQTQCFLCQNSWGTDVGEKGFFTIPYTYITTPSLAFDFWTISLFE